MSGVNAKDAVVFVTGANRGIGRAIVEEAVARGAAKVYATARNPESVQDLVDQHPGTVVAVQLDVTDDAQIRDAVTAAGDVQILINNAGVAGYSGAVFHHDQDAARLEMETNYFGPMNLSRAFAPAIVANGNGAVAVVVSVSGFVSFPMAATYSASKAAAHSLCQGMRGELGQLGVPVFGIYPGPIDTDMAAGMDIDKESPRNVAIRIFDGMQEGVEDITTDAFADALARNIAADAKAVEKEVAQMAHQPDL